MSIADSVACDLRALAFYRQRIAAVVAVKGVVYDDPLAQLVVVPAAMPLFGYRSRRSAIGASRSWLSKLTHVVLLYRHDRTTAGCRVSPQVGVLLIAALLVTALPPHTRPSGETSSIVVNALGFDQRRPTC